MEENISKLIERCILYFKDNCYTESRICRYKCLWRHGIIPFMGEREVASYNVDIGKEFVETCAFNGEVRPQEREKIRSIQVLDDMLKTGLIRKRCYVPVVYPLDGAIGEQMEKLVVKLENLRRCRTTTQCYRLYFSNFLSYLEKHGIQLIRDISEYHIIKFISSSEKNRPNYVSALRVLFRFWHEEHVTEENLEDILKGYNWRKKEKIPSFYSPEEVRIMENSICRSSNVGKRNYAMLLLASRLGLRASDIASLQFSSLDWEKNEIRLKQYKTGAPLSLPLLAEVGNAIIDYLKNGRPQSPGQNVFLSSRAPYVPASKNCVSSAITSVITQSGVSTKGKHHGPHSLRHSLAGCMLGQGSPLPVISEILGHKTTGTTMVYLKIDIDSLGKCALPVAQVPDSFYMQKGGLFYE